VRELREARGMTQLHLAFSARVSESLVAALEQGRTANPDVRKLLRVCGVLGVSPVEAWPLLAVVPPDPREEPPAAPGEPND